METTMSFRVLGLGAGGLSSRFIMVIPGLIL